MRSDSRALILALAALSSGCQLVARTETIVADPVNGANALPGYGGSSVPSSYDGRVRVADLAVTPGNIDFCIRVSGTSTWGEPVMFNSGTDAFFRGGLSYPEVTVPFAVPSGELDVKFIPAGKTCAASALSERDGISVGAAVVSDGGVAAPVVTLLRYGGTTGGAGDEGIAEAVSALSEETNVNPICQSGACARLRVVHAASMQSPINFGTTDDDTPSLPATVSTPILEMAMAPGEAAEGQLSALDPAIDIDPSGYTEASDGGAAYGIVATVSAVTARSAIVTFTPSAVPDTQTLFLVGDPSTSVHPLQGLLVEDDTAATGPADAGIDWAYLAKSTLTAFQTLSVDTIDAQQCGIVATAPNASYPNARWGPTVAALAARQTDAICITELDYDSLKAELAAAAAKGNFPYSYWASTTIATPPTNGAGWYGQTPPLVTTAACAGADPQALNAVVSCASQCSSGPDDSPDASITSLGCLQNACAAPLLPLLSNAPCYDCLVEYLLTGFAVNAAVAECSNDSDDPYGQQFFAGATPVMILSRVPFAEKPDGGADTDVYVLPSSSYRRVALRARLQVTASSQIDLYCAQLNEGDSETSVFPYAGPYATPDAGLYPTENTTDNGLEDENILEARDLLQWIASSSANTPAIVTGLWWSSTLHTDDAGEMTTGPYFPWVAEELMDAGLVPAHPPGYAYPPVNCPSPWETDEPCNQVGLDVETTYLYGFAAGATVSDTLWNNLPSEWNVTVPDVDGGPFPLSIFFPRTVQVLTP